MSYVIFFIFANAISHNFGETSLPRLGEKRCIRIKINKFKKAIHTVSQTSNSKLTCLFSKTQKKNKTKQKENKTKQQTHPKSTKQSGGLTGQKPPSVNSILEQLHSPTHVSSEGLLQYSIGYYTSTAFSKSSFTGPKSSPKDYISRPHQ